MSIEKITDMWEEYLNSAEAAVLDESENMEERHARAKFYLACAAETRTMLGFYKRGYYGTMTLNQSAGVSGGAVYT